MLASDGTSTAKGAIVSSAQLRGLLLPVLVALALLPGCAVSPPDLPTQSASASASRRPAGNWPDATNTGVPDGTELTPYSGECAITEPGTVIDAKLVNCNLRIRTTDVVITRSRILGNVSVPSAKTGFSFRISDSEVQIGANLNTGLGNANYVATRVEVTGGRRSAYCERNCTIEASWMHGQAGDPTGQAHMSGIRMSQDTVIRGNTVVCDGPRTPPESGCSAGLTGYGGFAPVQNNLIEGNIFYGGTAGYCAYGGSSESKAFAGDANRIRFIDNVFVRGESGKCGSFGAVASFDINAPGNEWSGNRWEDGELLEKP